MRKRRARTETLPQRLQVIPLIDVVFMLLAFLLITFKMNSPEGVFDIRMPATGGTAPSLVVPDSSLDIKMEPIRITLSSDPEGNLADIRFGSVSLGPNPNSLRKYIIELVGPTPSEKERKQWEAEIVVDRKLRYQHVIDATTQIRGYPGEGGVIPLIDQIKTTERS